MSELSVVDKSLGFLPGLQTNIVLQHLALADGPQDEVLGVHHEATA